MKSIINRILLWILIIYLISSIFFISINIIEYVKKDEPVTNQKIKEKFEGYKNSIPKYRLKK